MYFRAKKRRAVRVKPPAVVCSFSFRNAAVRMSTYLQRLSVRVGAPRITLARPYFTRLSRISAIASRAALRDAPRSTPVRDNLGIGPFCGLLFRFITLCLLIKQRQVCCNPSF